MVEWKPVSDFPNYEVSSDGQIRNVKTGRLISRQFVYNRYSVVLYRNNIQHNILVANLVAEAF